MLRRVSSSAAQQARRPAAAAVQEGQQGWRACCGRLSSVSPAAAPPARALASATSAASAARRVASVTRAAAATARAPLPRQASLAFPSRCNGRALSSVSAVVSSSSPAAPEQICGGATLPLWLGGRRLQDGEAAHKTLSVESKTHPGQAAGRVECASGAQIDRAFALAAGAERAMAQSSSHARRVTLQFLADALAARLEEFAEVVALETGKPVRDALVEVSRAVDVFGLSAEEAVRRPHGGSFEYMDATARSRGFSGITSYFPVGTVSMVVPFNFPLNLAAHKIGPAIAAGCPWVLKPSDRTPSSVCLFGEILRDAYEAGGLPLDAFSILPCELSDAPRFSEDERIKMLSFTGSTKVGWALREAAGRKKVTLELGGDAACIVDQCLTVDQLEHAAERIAFGAFFQAGQSCISVQRVVAHASCYDALRDLIVQHAARLVPSAELLDPSTEFGPLIAEHEAERVTRWVSEAAEGGARVLTGGVKDGPFVLPTVLEGVNDTCSLRTDEVFGPVVYLEKFEGSIEEAVDMVNTSRYGLQTGVFTPSLESAFYAFNNLEVGGVVVGDIPSTRIDSQPYGGVKESGLGREGVRYAIHDFTEPRIMLLKGLNPGS